MKQLTCEMCGNTDLIKQDGVFVCQSCGTKYSIEEAKKMMVEGAVDVSGSTVKVDTSEELKNLYQIARRAKDDNNNANAAKYYEMILVKDPTSWEANFYAIYYKSMSCTIGEITTAAKNVGNCIAGTFLLIRDYVKSPSEKVNAVTEIRDRVYRMSKMLSDVAKSHYDGIDSSIKYKFYFEYSARRDAADTMSQYLRDALCDVFTDDKDVMSTIGIQILKDRIAEGIAIDSVICIRYIEIIKKYDPDYQLPENSKTIAEITSDTLKRLTEKIDDSNSTNSSNSGGCYVATAVYGSYDCPQVWTLRRFRDYTLAETWYGRAFIRTYYAISPTLVKWFGHTEWFKKMWKGKLDRMVANLNADGVEDTPYKDRQW